MRHGYTRGCLSRVYHIPARSAEIFKPRVSRTRGSSRVEITLSINTVGIKIFLDLNTRGEHTEDILKKYPVVIPVVPVASDPKHPWVLILIPVLKGIIEHIRIESELMHKNF